MGRENQNPHPELQVHLAGELIHILAAVGLGHPEIWVGGNGGDDSCEYPSPLLYLRWRRLLGPFLGY